VCTKNNSDKKKKPIGYLQGYSVDGKPMGKPMPIYGFDYYKPYDPSHPHKKIS
jgi:hypothetical protein